MAIARRDRSQCGSPAPTISLAVDDPSRASPAGASTWSMPFGPVLRVRWLAPSGDYWRPCRRHAARRRPYGHSGDRVRRSTPAEEPHRHHLVLSSASAIIAPSEWLAKEARAQGWEPILCPFGVALDRWPPSEPRPRRPGAPLRLIHVASLNRVKDPFTLLDTLRLLADQGVGFHARHDRRGYARGRSAASLHRAFARRPGDISGLS